MEQLKTANSEVLGQLAEFIKEVPDHVYRGTEGDTTASIGRHVRHVLDMYLAVVDAPNCGEIDYDRRNRDSPVEHDKAAALREVERVLAWVGAVDYAEDSGCRLKTEVSTSCATSIVLASTMFRELCYVASHAVHHLAYMSLLARIQGVVCDDTIGLAPATATYRRSVMESTLS